MSEQATLSGTTADGAVMDKPRVQDWLFNPEYRDSDEHSVLRQPISKVTPTYVQALTFDLRHPYQKTLIPIDHLRWNPSLNGWEVRPTAPKDRGKFQGRFNWYGETHIFETTASNRDQAFTFMCSQLAKEVQRATSMVIAYFKRNPKSWSITELQNA